SKRSRKSSTSCTERLEQKFSRRSVRQDPTAQSQERCTGGSKEHLIPQNVKKHDGEDDNDRGVSNGSVRKPKKTVQDDETLHIVKPTNDVPERHWRREQGHLKSGRDFKRRPEKTPSSTTEIAQTMTEMRSGWLTAVSD